MNTQAKQQDLPIYFVGTEPKHVQTPDEDALIEHAMQILASRVNKQPIFTAPQDLRNYLALSNAEYEDYEVFSIMFLDSQLRLIQHKPMFRGTLTQTSVYPREIVKYALHTGASAVVLVHNHPSGDPTPSIADKSLTQTLKTALALVDVRVLDHFITGHNKCLSMAEKGLI